jgi:hypothetical protein
VRRNLRPRAGHTRKDMEKIGTPTHTWEQSLATLALGAYTTPKRAARIGTTRSDGCNALHSGHHPSARRASPSACRSQVPATPPVHRERNHTAAPSNRSPRPGQIHLARPSSPPQARLTSPGQAHLARPAPPSLARAASPRLEVEVLEPLPLQRRGVYEPVHQHLPPAPAIRARRPASHSNTHFRGPPGLSTHQLSRRASDTVRVWQARAGYLD